MPWISFHGLQGEVETYLPSCQRPTCQCHHAYPSSCPTFENKFDIKALKRIIIKCI